MKYLNRMPNFRGNCVRNITKSEMDLAFDGAYA